LAQIWQVERSRILRAEARLAAVRAQEAARAAILERLERATTAPELRAALLLVGTDSPAFETGQLDEHRERLGDLLATTIDDADGNVDALRVAVQRSLEAVAQVTGHSPRMTSDDLR